MNITLYICIFLCTFNFILICKQNDLTCIKHAKAKNENQLYANTHIV